MPRRKINNQQQREGNSRQSQIMRRVLWILFVFLFLRAAAKQAPHASDAEASLQPWFTTCADLVFVTHADQGLTTSLLKVPNHKYTVWNYNSLGLWEHIFKNRMYSVITRVFAYVPGDHVKAIIQSLGADIINGIATEWVISLTSSDFDQLVKVFYGSPAHMAFSAIVVDGRSVRKSLHCKQIRKKHRCFNTISDFPQKYERHVARRDLFSGENVRLACLDISAIRSCRTMNSIVFRQLLSSKNVSFTVQSYTSAGAMLSNLIAARVDVVVSNAEVTQHFLIIQPFADVSINYKTFYALHDGTYVVSLLDAMGSSPCVVLAATCLAFCAATIAIVRKLQFPRLSLIFPSNEVLFLLASLFGTSYTHPQLGRKVNISVSVYAVWMLGILPFSVYFRSELTSLVTISRPRDYLDTIAELERALEDDSVFPCVVKDSSAWESLEKWSNGSGRFFEKLRASYLRHKHEGIERGSVYMCIHCATSKNRVCFVHRTHSCWVKSQFKDVGEFKERFTLTLMAYPITKESTLTRPLRRIMSAMREGELVKKPLMRCDSKDTSAGSTFKLWGFFAQYIVLTCAATAVLIGEISVDRLLKRRHKIGPIAVPAPEARYVIGADLQHTLGQRCEEYACD